MLGCVRAVGSILCSVALLSGTEASAQSNDLQAHLVWQRPAASTCIAQRELEKRVEHALGRRAFTTESDADLELGGGVERRAGEWVARIAMAGHGVPRELRSTATECEALNTPLVVVLTTLLSGFTEPEIGSASRRSEWQLAASASGHVGHSLFPDLTWGMSAGLAARSGELPSLWLELALWPGATVRDSSGQGAHIEAASVVLSVCPQLTRAGAWGVSVCGSARALAMRARGAGLALTHEPVRGLAQLGVEAALTFAIAPALQLRFGLEAASALFRPRFYYEREDGRPQEVHRPQLFGVLARFGFIIGEL